MKKKIGFALCGSFCTHKQSLAAMRELLAREYEIYPIVSEIVYQTDTKFGTAAELLRLLEGFCGRPVIHTIKDAEPFGPALALDGMVIASCTGNTAAKLARGITDTAVTMAAKAHLRSDRPLLLALSSNDALSANLGSISLLLERKNVFFVPMRQDDPVKKPHSLIADSTLIPDALEAAMNRRHQMQPIFLAPKET